MELTSGEVSAMMLAFEIQWRTYCKWGWSNFPYALVYDLWERSGCTIASDFYEAMREAIDGTD